MGLKININSGNHDREFCPITFSLTKKQLVEKGIESFVLHDEEGTEVPYQTVDCGEQIQVALLIEHLEKGKQVSYKLISGKPNPDMKDGVKFSQHSNKVDIDISGEYFSSYVYDKQYAKPYLGPIKLSEGNDFTRLDFDIKEHPHHRSIWVAIGDVNGVDFWNEPAGVYGKQHHQSLSELNSGAIFGSLTTKNVWTNFKDTPIIDEERTFTFYNTPSDRRIIDVKVVFYARYGQVEFGATKEAGPLGIRMSEKLKADNGGTMVNSYGGIGEAECWGRQAHWCDYYGESNDQLLGIAAFDNPGNMDFPAHWHIRDYGLMAPNNFYFLGGKLLKPNDVVEYQYRLFFHSGDTQESGVEQQYHNYVNPPKVTIE